MVDKKKYEVAAAARQKCGSKVINVVCDAMSDVPTKPDKLFVALGGSEAAAITAGGVLAENYGSLKKDQKMDLASLASLMTFVISRDRQAWVKGAKREPFIPAAVRLWEQVMGRKFPADILDLTTWGKEAIEKEARQW